MKYFPSDTEIADKINSFKDELSRHSSMSEYSWVPEGFKIGVDWVKSQIELHDVPDDSEYPYVYFPSAQVTDSAALKHAGEGRLHAYNSFREGVMWAGHLVRDRAKQYNDSMQSDVIDLSKVHKIKLILGSGQEVHITEVGRESFTITTVDNAASDIYVIPRASNSIGIKVDY